ncbi:MAG: hypothetical protein DWQ44_08935 [Bacteroidetes bacterium]|nr:MAG: hypothetical protein DWQ33_02840 [Bacteroidota bacterium]REK06414.1 MAG: hypothetical protein DWQ39_02725 [Bacteroidota bacterium]REK33180.1 MAG: hypothetical protein DWQ44_08935 [Bacteroidota bacterium]
MRLRFSLDGNILIEIPKGADQLTSTLRYDKTIKARLLTQDAKLNFFQDGYLYVKAKFEQDLCNEIAVLIEIDIDENGFYQTYFEGYIPMPSCEFSIHPNSVSCSIEDRSFYSRISKNRGIKAKLSAGRTKNDVPIDPAVYHSIEYFRQNNGAYNFLDRYTYPAYEVLKYLVRFMSDDEIEFHSDVFSITGEYGKLGIIIGRELRGGGGYSHSVIPEISFEETIREIDKKYHIAMMIDRAPSGKFRLRVEKDSDLRSGSTSVSIPMIKNIKMKVDASLLYAYINAGSNDTDDNSALEFPEQIRFVGFRDEQLPVVGQCNTDNSLDLKSNWVISSNVIFNQVSAGSSIGHDDKIFMVEVDWSTGKAMQSDWLDSGYFFYNEGLTNQKCIERWAGGIPRSIANYLGGDDHRFSASKIDPNFSNLYFDLTGGGAGSFGAQLNPRDDFSAPRFDTNNNYGDGTAQGSLITVHSKKRFTAALGGFYRFRWGFHLIVTYISPGANGHVRLKLKRYNSSNSLIEERVATFAMQPYPAANYQMQNEMVEGFTMNAGDYILPEFGYTKQNLNTPLHADVTVLDTFFSCPYNSIGGGLWKTIDSADFPALFFSFNAPLSFDQYKQIIQSPSGAVEFGTDEKNYIAWVDNLKHNLRTGMGTFSLSSTLKQLPK